MKVAVIQCNAGANKTKNIESVVRLTSRAISKKAKLIVLPEVYSYRGNLKFPKALLKVAEDIPGESTKPLIDLARKNKVCIIAGSVYEKSKQQAKAYNTSVFIDALGKIRSKYRKINMFDAVIGNKKIKESNVFIPGKKLYTVKYKEFNIGLSICYDLRFPDLYQRLSLRGANVLCVPASFTQKTGEAHWITLLRARAIENLSYVLAPNQIGKDGRGINSYGHSAIIDPWGKVIVEASGNKEEIIYATLNKSVIERSRKILPSFKP